MSDNFDPISPGVSLVLVGPTNGDDFIAGTTGADNLAGGLGNDTYVINNTGDVITENPGEGTDTVQTTFSSYALQPNVENLTFTDNGTHTGTGNGVTNVMTGGAGDTFFGGAGSDTLNGGDGNDTLVGNDDPFASVADTLNGGNGNDTILGELTDTINGGAGTDFLFAVNSNPWSIDLGATSIEWMSAGFGNDTINASTQTAGVTVYASGGDDMVTGSNFDDFLWGGVGNDTLIGGAGNDLLFGDLGADSLSGGAGNDTIYADSADTLIDGGAGTDVLYWTEDVAANFDMAARSIEWMQTQAGNDTVTGATGAADLIVFAGAGNDTVTGGSGADFLWGEAGNDTLVGGAGNDTAGRRGRSRSADRRAGTDNLYGNIGTGGDGAADTYVFDARLGHGLRLRLRQRRRQVRHDGASHQLRGADGHRFQARTRRSPSAATCSSSSTPPGRSTREISCSVVMRRVAKRIAAQHGRVHFCYEAGPNGLRLASPDYVAWPQLHRRCAVPDSKKARRSGEDQQARLNCFGQAFACRRAYRGMGAGRRSRGHA